MMKFARFKPILSKGFKMTLRASWKFGRLNQTSRVRLLIALFSWTCYTFSTFLALIVFVSTTVSMCCCRTQPSARHLEIGGICVWRIITSTNLLIVELFDTLDRFGRKLLLLWRWNFILVRSHNLHIHVFSGMRSQFMVQIRAILRNVRVVFVTLFMGMVWTCFKWLLGFVFGNLYSHTIFNLLKFRCLVILRRVVLIVARLCQKLVYVYIPWGALNLWLNLLLVFQSHSTCLSRHLRRCVAIVDR